MVAYKEHAVVPPDTLLDDPAYAAEVHGLIGRHDPQTLARVGAWRWSLLQKYREIIVPMLKRGRALDFGGAAAPVGYGAVVVDRLAEHRALYDVVGPFDCIIISHTLEHIVALDLCVAMIHGHAARGAALVVVVPSCNNIMLRADSWQYHAHTFTLERDPSYPEWIQLDGYLDHAGWDVKHAEDDGNNIIVIALKRENI